MEIKKTWSDFKNLLSSKELSLQFIESDVDYYVWANESNNTYFSIIDKDDAPLADQIEFETSYKPNGNKPVQPLADDGRLIVRAESRPLSDTIVWTSTGDSATGIGDGTDIRWDFGNDDNLVTAPTGFKRKRISFQFLDSVRVKDGMLFFYDAIKNGYVDMFLVCPAGGYYLKNDGTPALASEDTKIMHYINKCFIDGSVGLGIPYNSEGCTDAIPAGYVFWLEVTTPDTDILSYGNIRMELFRKRTMVL